MDVSSMKEELSTLTASTLESPTNGKFLARYNHSPPDVSERLMFSDWRDSTLPKAFRPLGKVGNRGNADVFRGRPASHQKHFFPCGGLVFLPGQFAIGFQNPFQGVSQVFSSLFQCLALSVNARVFLQSRRPAIRQPA